MKRRLTEVALLLVASIAILTTIQTKSFTRFSLETESDPILEIEEWMVQDDYWTSGFKLAPNAADEELNLEEWMVDDYYWK